MDDKDYLIKCLKKAIKDGEAIISSMKKRLSDLESPQKPDLAAMEFDPRN